VEVRWEQGVGEGMRGDQGGNKGKDEKGGEKGGG